MDLPGNPLKTDKKLPKLPRAWLSPRVLLIVVLLLVASTTVTYLFLSRRQAKQRAGAPGALDVTVELKTEYKNPFAQNTQYVNPFDEHKNPLQNL